MKRGLFITVEGTEGVGKSTQMDFVESRLRDAGIDVVRTREPGGTPLAEKIRRILLDHGEEELPDTAELLLFFASRSLNIENAIRPSLEKGSWVLCDRFTDASRAYQGAGRGQHPERIDTLAEWVHGDLNPDVTLLLDAPAEVGLERARSRGEADRLETEKLPFYVRVREHYRALAAAEPERFAIVDAAGTLDEVKASVASIVDDLINDFRNHS